MYVVTPRCDAAAVVSAVVLRRNNIDYMYPYSMMHRRLPTAGIDVAPHYHQLLVVAGVPTIQQFGFPSFMEAFATGCALPHMMPLAQRGRYRIALRGLLQLQLTGYRRLIAIDRADGSAECRWCFFFLHLFLCTYVYSLMEPNSASRLTNQQTN